MTMITVTVVYALKKIQHIYVINVKQGSTVKEAILASKFLNICKNICLNQNKVGIYNKLVSLDSIVQNNDRIEIYRSLCIDPNERRKKYIFAKKK